jgi:nucleotide-binding universal stress UspA family protein
VLDALVPGDPSDSFMPRKPWIGGYPLPEAPLFSDRGENDPPMPNARWGTLAAGERMASDAGVPLLVVNDPLLLEASVIASGRSNLVEETVREMQRFFKQTLGTGAKADVEFEVASGKPAPEILRVSRKRGTGLIVMASHGLSGFRKLFFGSTTERVLRETTVPTLVTSGSDAGPSDFEELRKAVRRVLVPVDLTAATAHQVSAARAIAQELTLPLLLAHVIEPVRPLSGHPALPTVETERRYRAEAELEGLTSDAANGTAPEALIAYGDSAEEIAKVASDRGVGLIVMGLHSSPLLGPRMGSVTYRVLCLAHRLVLALPPQAEHARQDAHVDVAAGAAPITG